MDTGAWAKRTKFRSRAGFWRDVAARDAASFRLYGAAAPRWCQRIWVDPADCDRIVMGFHDADSATIVDGDWDLAAEPLRRSPQIRFSRMHWEQNIPWEATGAYEYLLELIAQRGGPVDGCETREDAVRRYEALDRAFERVRREGRLRSQAELHGPARSFRERGGVLMHIDRDCRPVFGCKGHHRLAIAQILGLALIPTQLGVIHPDAMPAWKARFVPQPATGRRRTGPPDAAAV